jgi:hypothetical protein
MCAAAPTDGVAGELLGSIVLQPVATALAAHVTSGGAQGCRPACELLMRLISTRRVTVVDSDSGAARAREPSGDATPQASIGCYELMRKVVHAACEDAGGTGWQEQCAGEAELLGAMLRSRQVAPEALASCVMADIWHGSAEELHSDLAQAVTAGAAVRREHLQQLSASVHWPALHGAAHVLRRCERAKLVVNGEEGSLQQFEMLGVCGLLLHSGPVMSDVAALVRLAVDGGTVPATQEPSASLPWLVVLGLEDGAASCDADAAAATQQLVPVAEVLAQTALSGSLRNAATSGEGGDAGTRALLTLYSLALDAQMQPAAAGDEAAALQDAALASWHRLAMTSLPGAPSSADDGVRLSYHLLVHQLVRRYTECTSIQAPAAPVDGEQPEDDALRIAHVAASAGSAAAALLALALRADGQAGVRAVWAALRSRLPDLLVADAVLESDPAGKAANGNTGSAAPDRDALSAAVLQQERAMTASSAGRMPADAQRSSLGLAPELALPLAVVLHIQDEHVLAGAGKVPLALALECALRPGFAAGPALAGFLLHHTNALRHEGAAEGVHSEGAGDWAAAVEVLALMQAQGSRAAGAAVLQLVSQLPSEHATQLAAEMFQRWAPEHASPAAVAHSAEQLASAQDLLEALAAHIHGSDMPQAARAAQEDLALQWLKHLQRSEPLLAMAQRGPKPSQAGAQSADSDTTAQGARFVASLFTPLRPAQPSQQEHEAFSDAYALLNALSADRGDEGSDAHSDASPDLRITTAAASAQYSTTAHDSSAVAAVQTQLSSHSIDLAAPWAANMSEELVSAFAACAPHQLRAVNVNVQACPQPHVAALLRLLVVCFGAAQHKLADVVWQRGLRMLHDYLGLVTVAAEERTERLCAAIVPLAESIPGSPRNMDVAFALMFLSRLASQPGVVPKAARATFEASVEPVLPDAGPEASFQLVEVLRHAADEAPARFAGNSRQLAEQFAEMDGMTLRIVLCAGACLAGASAAGCSGEAATRVLRSPHAAWQCVARAVTRQAHGAVLRAAVEEFDSWSQELGVQTFDAAIGLLAFADAPVALRALALQCAAQAPLLQRVAFVHEGECVLLPASYVELATYTIIQGTACCSQMT